DILALDLVFLAPLLEPLPEDDPGRRAFLRAMGLHLHFEHSWPTFIPVPETMWAFRCYLYALGVLRSTITTLGFWSAVIVCSRPSARPVNCLRSDVRDG